MIAEEIAERYGARIKALLDTIRSILKGKGITADAAAEFFGPAGSSYAWGVRVHPFGKIPQNETLNIYFLILQYPGKMGAGFPVSFEIDLITSEDKFFGQFDSGLGAVDSTNEAALEAKLLYFEVPLVLRSIANRAMEYVAKVRSSAGPGPHEWVPGWDRPTMGASRQWPKLAVIEKNIVEQPGWKEVWEPGNVHMSRASDLAADHVRDFDLDFRKALLHELAGDIYDPTAESGPQDWSPRAVISPADVDAILEGMEQSDSKLEAVQGLILDTATWMYEEALTPNDGDIRAALDKAKDTYEEKNRFSIDYDLWEPLMSKDPEVTGRLILHDLLTGIRYTRKQGQYDRYLVFDLNEVKGAWMLLGEIPVKDRRAMARALDGDWSTLADGFTKWFLSALQQEMESEDISNRIDWRKAWFAARPKDGSKEQDAIQQAMMAYAREARKSGTSS